MMFRTIAFAALVLFCAGDAPPRSFTLSAEIEASRAELFRLWTTSEGARTVFPGADARVDGRAGGDFCIVFAPHVDPNGDSFGTNGCTIKDLEIDSRLVFEWRGRPDMPAMNERPIPTAVTLEFSALGDCRTRLTLTHAGFGTGPDWDPAFEYFQSAWRSVLDGLVNRFAAAPMFPRKVRDAEPRTLYVVELTPGPNWLAGKPATAQPRIMNHAAYMLSLIESGQVLMGGRIGDDHGLAILQVPDRARAERLLAADPAVQAGTFAFTIRPWNAVLQDAPEQATRSSSDG